MSSNKVLGIDLGTGFSAMAIMEQGKATIIPNSDGARTTPSIIAWDKNGNRLVGQAAKRQAVTNPKIQSMKLSDSLVASFQKSRMTLSLFHMKLSKLLMVTVESKQMVKNILQKKLVHL